MALSNAAVSARFVEGFERGKAYSMSIDGRDLYSRRTILARRLDEDTIAVNHKKYSISTTMQQSEIRRALDAAGFVPTGVYIEPPASGYPYYPSDEPFEIYRRINTEAQAA